MGRELLLYKRMIKQGNAVTLLTYGNEDDYRYAAQLDGIDVVPVYNYFKKNNNRWINLLKSFLIPFNSKLRKVFKNANIYKTNQMPGAWVAIVAKVIFKKPLVVRCGYEMLRNTLRDEKRLFAWAIKAFLGYIFEYTAYTLADTIIISNLSDKRFIKKLIPVKKDKIKLIRNFIDTNHFSVKNSNRIRINRRRILFIGRIEQRKNVKNLIIGSCGAGCELDLVGAGSHQAYCEKMVRDNHCHVNFLGVVDNKLLPEIIAQYDIYIIPSYYENNPKSLLEAMACARIVLGSDVDGIKELIDDGVTGFLCDTDADSIKNALNKVFGTNQEKLKSIAENARKFVLQECSIENVYRQEFEVYMRFFV